MLAGFLKKKIHVFKKIPLLVILGKGGPGSKRKRQWDAVKDETGFPPLSNYVALDCEFVGVRNDESCLGRCSIVDSEGRVLCDLYAMPEDPITHYRTPWSGITRGHMKNAFPLELALAKISNILQGKIVVGHDLRRDFNVLGFQPQPEFIRDTSTFRGMIGPGANRRSLKSLSLEHLDLQIQVGPHCSIQDARAAMSLYRLVRHEWETNRLAENSSKNGNQGDWLSYVNRTMTDTWTKMYGICFNIKDVEADVVAEDKDISGLGGNENVDRIANDDYWVIKNPRDYKVGLSNIQQVFFENSESKLSVLNNKIKMDSGVVIKAKSITTKKSKKNFCGF